MHRELALHPVLRAADLYKLIYQATFGMDHWLGDPERVAESLLAEWAVVRPEVFRHFPLLQSIDPEGRTARLHLGPLKARGVDPLAVAQLVAHQEAKAGTGERLQALWTQVETLVAWLPVSFSVAELAAFRAVPAVPRHSAAYGPAAYRVLNDIRSPRVREAVRRWACGRR